MSNDQAKIRIRELEREIYRAQLLLAAVPALSPLPWSAAYRWRDSRQATHEHRIDRLKRDIAKLRRVAGPRAKFWKPMPVTAADRRIARQYRDLEATANF